MTQQQQQDSHSEAICIVILNDQSLLRASKSIMQEAYQQSGHMSKVWDALEGWFDEMAEENPGYNNLNDVQTTFLNIGRSVVDWKYIAKYLLNYYYTESGFELELHLEEEEGEEEDDDEDKEGGEEEQCVIS